jgi:hypothetical protein
MSAACKIVMDSRSTLLAWTWPLAAGLFAMLVYWRTMAPTLYGFDSAELAVGTWSLGIVHSPGCPLYLLIGRLFMLLPAGDYAYRLSLLSVVAAAGTVGCVCRILIHLTGARWQALLTSWILAFSYYFWIWGVVAEIYALHFFFVALLLLLTLQWRQNPRPARLALIAFLFGLATGNHQTLALLLPGFAWLILSRDKTLWKRPLPIMVIGICGAIGFFGIYSYLPIRHAANPPFDYVRDYFPHMDLASWPGFVWMLTGGMFKSLLFAVPWRDVPTEIFRFLQQAASNFGLAGGLLCLWGIAGLFRRCRDVAMGTLLMAGTHVSFILSYGALDKDTMYSAVYVIGAVWLGVGLHSLTVHLRRLRWNRWQPLPGVWAAGLAFLLLATNYPVLDLSKDDAPRRVGEQMLSAMSPDAVFLGMWEHVPILEYLQLVEGRRTDVQVRNLVFLGPEEGRRIAHEALGRQRPVYTTVPTVLADNTLLFVKLATCPAYAVFPADVWPPNPPVEHLSNGSAMPPFGFDVAQQKGNPP